MTSPDWGKVTRVAGADRYSTSVAISKTQFTPGVPVAYLADGANFPDALAGAPVAGINRGPVLLTSAPHSPRPWPTSSPGSNPNASLSSAAPERSATASPRSLTPTRPAKLTRAAGADRYSTSVAISKTQFTPGVPVAYLADGANFPDALAGAPVAGINRGPVLLTSATTLSKAVADELTRLKPQRIVILGGTGAISNSIAQKLDAYTTGKVTRAAGADRYSTSVAISKTQFTPGVPVAYLADGANFPDALAGAPVAGINRGPVLLTSATTLSKAVADELTRLKPQRIVILGGTGAISNNVVAQLDGLH